MKLTNFMSVFSFPWLAMMLPVIFKLTTDFLESLLQAKASTLHSVITDALLSIPLSQKWREAFLFYCQSFVRRLLCTTPRTRSRWKNFLQSKQELIQMLDFKLSLLENCELCLWKKFCRKIYWALDLLCVK